MGGRAVEGTGLENRQGCKLLVGSNPTPSANPPFRSVSDCLAPHPRPRVFLTFLSSVVSHRIVLSQHEWGNEGGNDIGFPHLRSQQRRQGPWRAPASSRPLR